MNGLGDSLTIGILLTLIFGAIAFYLYSRMSQNEKRVSLLENLLLTLKMSTEASLGGPDSVEAVSSPAPLQNDDVDQAEAEEEYADLLKEIPVGNPVVNPVVEEQPHGTPLAPLAEEEDEEDSSDSEAPVLQRRQVDMNYESMNVKELQALAKQRGIVGVPQRKRELIDALKKNGGNIVASLEEAELEGASLERGFKVDLEQ